MYTLEQRFAKWACDRLTQNADFGKKKIIFSDEAHFDLGGYVNKQNCCIWSTENSHAYIAKPTHPKRVTVWCGFWFRGIIGPFSSKISKQRPLQSMAIVIGKFVAFGAQKTRTHTLKSRRIQNELLFKADFDLEA